MSATHFVSSKENISTLCMNEQHHEIACFKGFLRSSCKNFLEDIRSNIGDRSTGTIYGFGGKCHTARMANGEATTAERFAAWLPLHIAPILTLDKYYSNKSKSFNGVTAVILLNCI
jgi:hypothetical protein